MNHGGHRQGAGRKPLPDDERKRPVLIKLPPRLISWMDSQADSRALLIESAMAEKFNLCPDCFRVLHLYHNCELNPVANPKEK
jgi:hypothetical protein